MERTLTSHSELITQLLQTYITDDVITETPAKILQLTQPPNVTSTVYRKALWNKALSWDQFYDEYFLKGILIEGLHGSL